MIEEHILAKALAQYAVPSSSMSRIDRRMIVATWDSRWARIAAIVGLIEDLAYPFLRTNPEPSVTFRI